MACSVYGTLISEKVFYRVISVKEGDHVRKSQYKVVQNVELNGYKRFKVRNELYPAAVSFGEGSSIIGALIYGLTISDLKFLDEFEGDEYRRVGIKVRFQDTLIDTEVYEWIADRNLLLDEEWELNDKKIDEFLMTFT